MFRAAHKWTVKTLLSLPYTAVFISPQWSCIELKYYKQLKFETTKMIGKYWGPLQETITVGPLKILL